MSQVMIACRRWLPAAVMELISYTVDDLQHTLATLAPQTPNPHKSRPAVRAAQRHKGCFLQCMRTDWPANLTVAT
jgi:hypothetical protein